MEILKNGKIIPMVGEPYEGDIAIENGKIHAMGVNLDYPNAEEINVSGCFVLPGFVDAHCHIGMWEDGIGFEGADDIAGLVAYGKYSATPFRFERNFPGKPFLEFPWRKTVCCPRQKAGIRHDVFQKVFRVAIVCHVASALSRNVQFFSELFVFFE